jgi:hypothetical protein
MMIIIQPANPIHPLQALSLATACSFLARSLPANSRWPDDLLVVAAERRLRLGGSERRPAASNVAVDELAELG